jgi:hypothetical protein
VVLIALPPRPLRRVWPFFPEARGTTLAISASTFTASTGGGGGGGTAAVYWSTHSPDSYTYDAANAAFGAGATTG